VHFSTGNSKEVEIIPAYHQKREPALEPQGQLKKKWRGHKKKETASSSKRQTGKNNSEAKNTSALAGRHQKPNLEPGTTRGKPGTALTAQALYGLPVQE